MGLYHSRLTQNDLKDLIIKYKIPRDLYPRLPSEEFVTSELPDDAIGVYHCMFDFSSVRVPFSLFLLALIKHYKRHPDSAINDLRPPDGSFNMEDMRRLSAHVVKLRDMPEGVLVLSSYGLPYYYTPPAAADVVIPEPTLEDLAASNPSVKVVAKAKASEKQKASTSGAALSHVAKQSDDDDDACYEIPLVTPIRSATVIPSLGNQGGGFAALAAEGPNTRDSRGKGIMTDVDVALSAGVSHARSSFGPASSFRDVSGDAIHREFFPFSTDQFPTPREMVLIEALSFDQLTAKMNILHCLMMSHGGELLARYRGLLLSHLSGLQRQVTGLNDKLSASDAAFAKSKDKGNERKKKIKSLTKSLDNLHVEVARLSADLNRATVLEAERDKEILCLKATPPDRVQSELLSLAVSAGFEQGLSMHRTKDEFAAVLGKISQFVPGAQVRLTEASSCENSYFLK
ncbi:hypothetical protein Tco_0749469, partial [Tanacetum coccineum]